MAEQIDADHPVVLLELGQHPVPPLHVARVAVQQHDRRSVVLARVGDLQLAAECVDELGALDGRLRVLGLVGDDQRVEDQHDKEADHDSDQDLPTAAHGGRYPSDAHGEVRHRRRRRRCPARSPPPATRTRPCRSSPPACSPRRSCCSATCRGSATPRRSSPCSSGSGSRSSGAATTACGSARRRGQRDRRRRGALEQDPRLVPARRPAAGALRRGRDAAARRRLHRPPPARRRTSTPSATSAPGSSGERWIELTRARGRPQGACAIFMDEPSVMGTENALMAAALTPGPTTISNAACEPHVQDLARLLVRRWAPQVDGIGSNVMTVHGRDKLGGAEHTICARPHRGRQLHGARRGDRRRAADPRRRRPRT